MKWITQFHVYTDRVACPWLSTRFIDSDAEFMYVPKSNVMEIEVYDALYAWCRLDVARSKG